MDAPTTRPARWLIARGLLRAAVSGAVMVAAYYLLLPLHARSSGYLIVELAVGLAVFSGVVGWQVRAISRSAYPRIRAIQALATATPLFLLLFSSTYFILSEDAPGTFTEVLSRTDALYFTVTVFATVGFGDITAQDEFARLIVTVQMLLDLVVLGLGIQVILGAVQRGQASRAAGSAAPEA